jgi:hypothetical protein
MPRSSSIHPNDAMIPASARSNAGTHPRASAGFVNLTSNPSMSCSQLPNGRTIALDDMEAAIAMNTDIEDFFQDGLETLAFDQTSSHIPPGAPDLNGRSWFGDFCDAPLRDSTNNTEKVSISRSGAEHRLQVRAAVLLILFFSPRPASAADVKPETAQAWQEYIKAAEARPTDAAKLRGEILVSSRPTAQDETLDATNTHAEARDSNFRQSASEVPGNQHLPYLRQSNFDRVPPLAFLLLPFQLDPALR